MTDLTLFTNAMYAMPAKWSHREADYSILQCMVLIPSTIQPCPLHSGGFVQPSRWKRLKRQWLNKGGLLWSNCVCVYVCVCVCVYIKKQETLLRAQFQGGSWHSVNKGSLLPLTEGPMKESNRDVVHITYGSLTVSYLRPYTALSPYWPNLINPMYWHFCSCLR